MADDDKSEKIEYRGDDELADTTPTPGAPQDEEAQYRGESELADAVTAADAEEAPDVDVEYRGSEKLAGEE